MQPVPIFGDTFATFFPLVLIFLVIINAFNVYGKRGSESRKNTEMAGTQLVRIYRREGRDVEQWVETG